MFSYVAPCCVKCRINYFIEKRSASSFHSISGIDHSIFIKLFALKYLNRGIANEYVLVNYTRLNTTESNY